MLDQLGQPCLSRVWLAAVDRHPPLKSLWLDALLQASLHASVANDAATQSAYSHPIPPRSLSTRSGWHHVQKRSVASRPDRLWGYFWTGVGGLGAGGSWDGRTRSSFLRHEVGSARGLAVRTEPNSQFNGRNVTAISYDIAESLTNQAPSLPSSLMR
ncbi:hypothetical protein VTK26DRAFT_5673 [Humicola hyalothermophila]